VRLAKVQKFIVRFMKQPICVSIYPILIYFVNIFFLSVILKIIKGSLFHRRSTPIRLSKVASLVSFSSKPVTGIPVRVLLYTIFKIVVQIHLFCAFVTSFCSFIKF